MRTVETDHGASVVAHAATRGVVGALAMSGLRALTQSLGLLSETPPNAIAGRKARGLLRKVPRRRRQAVIETVHCGVGAMGGAGFGLLPESVRRRAWSGPAYGLGIWALYEVGIAPHLGFLRYKHSTPSELGALAADHLLYGFVLSEMRRRPRA